MARARQRHSGRDAGSGQLLPALNSAIVFDRRVKDKTLEFGVSGMLRNSDMAMYDRQTDSVWQQITGEGISALTRVLR